MALVEESSVDKYEVLEIIGKMQWPLVNIMLMILEAGALLLLLARFDGGAMQWYDQFQMLPQAVT
jgi:hypothetical protein